MATRARLQRRLEARKKEAENAVDEEAENAVEIVSCSCCGREMEATENWNDLEITESELLAAEDSGISLVEELWKQSPEAFACFIATFPKSWSLHRVIAAFSISPHFAELWRDAVEIHGLKYYYVLRCVNYLKYRVLHVAVPAANAYRQWLERESPKISSSDRVLVVIFGHLNIWDCLGLINLVCRRWHFVARYVWQRMEAAQIVPENAPFSSSALLKPSAFVYRMSGLTNVTLCGTNVSIGCVPKMLTKTSSPPVDTLRICSVTFESAALSLADANDKVCDFIRGCDLLKELVLMDCYLCLVDKTRNRRELRSLDLWYFEFSDPKTDRPLKIDKIQLSAKTLQRFADNFKFFCKQVFESKVKAVIVCGLATSSYAAGLSRANFVNGFTCLMPHLREISLCNLLFPDGTNLETASLDLLAQHIRRNSNLELFCLTNAKISEEAIYNLQRCEKLQILILLRCSITSKYPDLPLIAGWHPKSSLPGSLITDDVTVPRWLKPTYFRVVRIDSFTQLSENKFFHLRNRWWTIRALLKSAELNLPDFYFASSYLDAEEIICDAVWLHELLSCVSRILVHT